MENVSPRPSDESHRRSCPQVQRLDLSGLQPVTKNAELISKMRRSRSLQRLPAAMETHQFPIDAPSRTSRESHARVPPDTEVLSDRTPEEQRYERMMERFHLRHLSPAAPPPLSGAAARIATRRNSMDRSTVAMTARRTSLLPSLNGGSGVSSFNAHDSSTAPIELTLVLKAKMHAAFIFDLLVVWVENLVYVPFEPTSTATRARLCVLVAVLMATVLYAPFGIAYDDYDEWANTADAIVDVIFLLNILATCNTETRNAQHQVVTSRRAIWHHYRRNGFALDVLAALPLEQLLVVVPHYPGAHWFSSALKLTVQSACVRRHVTLFHSSWSKEAMASGSSSVALMLFSRYSHLLRIGRIILFIALVSHYFASLWSWLHVGIDPEFFLSRSIVTIHMDSIYDMLQLLQGQGMETKTPGQTLFGSVAVLVGSIALAVMFGNVAILVGNFGANSTAYQQRMEHVFAIMGKLGLPQPIRERVHQYYEHVHTEYELLDGEISKFAKGLSHTLTLETVLFLYMDVLVNVPHWHGCSPDFQTQLVLSLRVRIYLPDDYIMRRGEVGAECYLINRGSCKLYEYPSGNYEPPTPAMPCERMRPSKRRHRLPSVGRQASKASSRGLSELDGVGNGPYSHISELTRGQAIGEYSLLANYERSSDLRAITHMEMCVIDRESFQRILTRYPQDRRIVVTSIVRHLMKSLGAQGVPCKLMAMVQQIAPQSSLDDAIQLVAQAIDSPKDDRSIVFGFSEQLARRVGQAVEAEIKGKSDADEIASGPCSVEPALPITTPLVSMSTCTNTNMQMVALLEGILERLTHWRSPMRRREARLVNSALTVTQTTHSP